MPNEELKAIQRQIGLWPVVAPPALFAAVMVAFAMSRSASTAWLFVISYLIVTAVVVVFQLRHTRRLRAKVVEADKRVCVHCLYSLADLPAPGVCPECGRDYPADAYAAAWVRAWPQMLGKYSNIK